ncbi:hypothetical protein KH172YL63_38880 [Bacillus sp. KH172YL63]|nr:hypothetical protein KH172YL63_38880 [Bacillus sp. KH172YL63]
MDEGIAEQEFIDVIKSIYKGDCYIYAIIPEWEEELLYLLDNDFIQIHTITFPLVRISPRTRGFVGYIKVSKKRYIYEFYLRSTSIDFLVYSGFDVAQHLKNINKKNIDLYKIFSTNNIPHITIGPDGQWLNVAE